MLLARRCSARSSRTGYRRQFQSRVYVTPNFPLVTRHSSFSFYLVEDLIDSFIRFLAVERGLSENYQFSTQRSLSDFAHWCAASKKIDSPRGVTLPVISEYLAERKRAGLSASTIDFFTGSAPMREVAQ